MDRHAAPSNAPVRHPSARLRAEQEEAFDGLLLAMLARKRLLVLVGSDRGERGHVLRMLADHVASDGSLSLLTAADASSTVESLLLAAAGSDEDADIDTVAAAIEQNLEHAGAGVFAIDEAHRLPAATLADLVEFTRSETPAGRFLQILLCGAADLERALAHPDLAEALRDQGVIYRLVPGATCSTVPEPEVHAIPANDPIAPDVVALRALHEARTGEGCAGAPQRARRPRRFAVAGAVVTVAIMLAVGAAGASVYLPETRNEALSALRRAATGTQAWATSLLDLLFDDDLAEDSVALGPVRTADATPRAAATPSAAPQPPAPAPLHPPGKPEAQIQAPQPAALALAPNHHPHPGAAAATAVPPSSPEPSVLPPRQRSIQVEPLPPLPPGSPPAAAEPPVTVAALPPATTATATPATAPTATAAAPPVPLDPAVQRQVSELVETARRQIAAKRLTTPPGDNAADTVQRIRALAPQAAEAELLVEDIKAVYRRWAAASERERNWAEAQRFYERALSVDPEDAEVMERLRALDSPQPDRPVPAAPETIFASANGALAALQTPDGLRDLLAGRDPDRRLPDGKTLLMLAAERGLGDAARVLLERGASLAARSPDGATPVMYAAWYGHADLITAMAAAGADLNARNNDGKTALMAAAARGNGPAVRALLDRGANVDAVASHGWTALMYAANAGHESVARLLVARGADPFHADDRGNSAYTLGALQGHTEVVEALRRR